jgi:two-component system CheB/CheR fusion protein
MLFLSPSESIGNHTDLFSSLNRKWKFYRATHSITSSRSAMANVLSWTAETTGKASEVAISRPNPCLTFV